MSLSWDQANSTLTVDGNSVVLSGTTPKAFRTFRHTVTGQNIISDQSQDVLKFTPGEGIQLNFNQSTDTITFEMDPAFRFGFTGSTGFTGSQGAQGIDGAYAALGYTGSQGDIGFSGSAGAFGFTGSQGPKGFSGSIGFTGSLGVTGDQGIQGDTGFTGSQGAQGFTGSLGTAGPTGSTGTQGNVGFTGSQGFVGSTGSSGPQGNLGPTGFTGSTGLSGAIGYAGSKGNVGFSGSIGVGYTGSMGNQGYTGSQGAQGNPGEAANIGYTGSKGIAGPTGFTGSSGPLGPEGVPGPGGFTGSRGQDGIDGAYAALGYTGSQGPTGFTGSQGTGFTGSQGAQGDQGVQGAQGFTGSAGASGNLQQVTDLGNVTTNGIQVETLTVGGVPGTGVVLGLALPVNPTDAASKEYVDTNPGGLDAAAVQALIDAEVQDPTTLVLGTSCTGGIQIGKDTLVSTLSGGGIALGQNADASGSQAIAIGIGAVGENSAVAIGISAQTSTNSVSIGRSANSTGSKGVAVGNNAFAQGTATAVGAESKAGDTVGGTGLYSVALGADSYAQYNNSMHINSSFNTGTGPSAIGGIVLESSLGRMEYIANSDWEFNAPVKSSEFKFADGTSMTTAPTGGGNSNIAVATASDGQDYLTTFDTSFFITADPTSTDTGYIALGSPASANWNSGAWELHGTGSGRSLFNSKTITNKIASNGPWIGMVASNDFYLGSRYAALYSDTSYDVTLSSDPLGHVNLAIDNVDKLVVNGPSNIIQTFANVTINSTTEISGVIDDGTMATASNTTLATSESIKTYVDASSGGNYGNVEVQDYLESLTSVIIGKDASTLISSESHVIIGDGARVINSGVGIGENAYCYKEGVAIGRESLSGWNGHRAIAIGELAGSKNLGFDSVALGYKAGGGAWRSAAYPNIRNHTTHIGGETGSDDPGVGTTALGYQAGKSDSGNYSVAVGFQAGQSNQGTNSIIISSLGSPVNNSDSGSITIKSNAAGGLLEYDPSSNVWTLGASVTTNGGVISGLIDPTQPDHAASKSYVDAKPTSGIAIGNVTVEPTAAFQSIAIGEAADASVAFAIAIGKNSSAPNNFGIAIGENSAAATNSVALGYNADASTNYTTAVGWSARAIGPASTALGHECEATGSASIAMGSDSTASSSASMAIGYKSDVQAAFSTSIGHQNDISTTGSYTISIGNYLANNTYTEPDAIKIAAGSTYQTQVEVRPNYLDLSSTGFGIACNASVGFTFTDAINGNVTLSSLVSGGTSYGIDESSRSETTDWLKITDNGNNRDVLTFRTDSSADGHGNYGSTTDNGHYQFLMGTVNQRIMLEAPGNNPKITGWANGLTGDTAGLTIEGRSYTATEGYLRLEAGGDQAIEMVNGSTTINSANATVQGNLTADSGIVVNNGTVRLANLTTTERNLLTAANGDMIYNTTDGRIQAYQAGTWINLDDGTAA